MKITFLLPTPGDTPIGGVKVVYEHANGLAAAGHKVCVVHTMTGKTRAKGFLSASKTYLGRLIGLKGGYGAKRWMDVHENVRSSWVPALIPSLIPKGDIVIATASSTAEAALRLNDSYGKKYYFVQEYEYFMTAEPTEQARIAATYKAPFRNLVISPACRDMVISSGGAVHAEVPNGLDMDLYRLLRPIDDPERTLIGFPSRPESFKRTEDAIEALTQFRTRHPDSGYGFWTFGGKKPIGLPDWITFHQRPSDQELVDLYNRTSIFVVPSCYEGWGLPGSEAMCCGAALVSTDNGGVNAYAKNDMTALLSSPMKPDVLAQNIERLAGDPVLRKKIGSAGLESISKLTWAKSKEAFLGAITSVQKNDISCRSEN